MFAQTNLYALFLQREQKTHAQKNARILQCGHFLIISLKIL
jgi:hypothetical protein